MWNQSGRESQNPTFQTVNICVHIQGIRSLGTSLSQGDGPTRFSPVEGRPEAADGQWNTLWTAEREVHCGHI